MRGTGDRSYHYGADNRLQAAGGMRFTHDQRGFRSQKRTAQGNTEYYYAPDYRLLGVDLPDGRTVEYRHDEHGLRCAKNVAGSPPERYFWRSFTQLAAWHDGERLWTVEYGQGGRAARLVSETRVMDLHTDQIGSVRAVVDHSEGMVKEVLYDSFGNLVRDSNPYVRVPLGFAGGLHDWDTGLVRFGWRDYDTDTGRWTAPDPIGARGGDPDWYGYCLDDPINGVDPTGLGKDTPGKANCEDRNLYCKYNECTDECQLTGTYRPITEEDAQLLLNFPIPGVETGIIKVLKSIGEGNSSSE